MDFPLQIDARWSASPYQLQLTDMAGRPHGYVGIVSPQPRKAIVYADATATIPTHIITADGRNEFTADYLLTTASGERLGSVKRSGVRSIWRAHYAITVGDTTAFEVTEENPYVKLLNSIVQTAPFVGGFTGLFLNPTYRVARLDGTPVLRLTKQRSFREQSFGIEKIGELSDAERDVAVLALMMVIVSERSRG